MHTPVKLELRISKKLSHTGMVQLVFKPSTTEKEVIQPLAMYRHVNLKLLTTPTREE
jgi:hypothetical protein